MFQITTPTIKHICCVNRGVQDYELDNVLTILRQENTVLTTLNLCLNSITCNGAYDISKALLNNTVLTSLLLRGNNINDTGAMAIANMLLHNTSLKNLDLGDNHIYSNGVLLICKSLLTNTTLTNLELDGNDINSECILEIAKILQRNTSLLYISVNNSMNNVLFPLLKRNKNYNKCHSNRDTFIEHSKLPNELNVLVNKYVLEMCYWHSMVYH